MTLPVISAEAPDAIRGEAENSVRRDVSDRGTARDRYLHYAGLRPASVDMTAGKAEGDTQTMTDHDIS